MSWVRGDVSSLARIAGVLRVAPSQLSLRVSTDVAPVLTQAAVAAYVSGSTVYGDARPYGAPSLVRTGATLASLRFVTIGDSVRCVLGTTYAPYLVKRYQILPDAGLPSSWSLMFDAATKRAITEAYR